VTPQGAPSRIRPATRGDAPEIVELLVACDLAEVGEPETSLADLESDWAMDGFDLSRDAWVAEGAAGPVGYAYAGDQLRTGELEGDLWVHPEHHEPELGDRLLGLAERRAAALAVERGYPDPTLNVYCVVASRRKRDLLRRHGYQVRRTVYQMSVDLAGGALEEPAPEGVALRPFRPDTDDRVLHDVMSDAFQDHFHQSREPFEAWRSRLLGHPSFDPGLWWVAWDDGAGEAVGALIAYDHGDLGWVQGVGVLRGWRRRGLGAALLTHAFAAFAARGRTRVDLSVDAEGATRPLRLYERLGMEARAVYELYDKRLAG
jgi:mycothiol synthase